VQGNLALQASSNLFLAKFVKVSSISTGETLTQAVLNALQERIKNVKEKRKCFLKDELLQIGKECAALPVLDNRSPEEILGYNNSGVAN